MSEYWRERLKSADIDVESGLSYVAGNEIIYKRFLNKFYNNYIDFCQTLDSVYQKKDLKKAEELAHSLKGVAGYIGAEDLFKISKSLEFCFREQNLNNVNSKIENLNKVLNKILSAVADIDIDSQQPGRRLKNKKEVKQSLYDLERMLKDSDSEAVIFFREIKSQLGKYLNQNNIKNIEDYIEKYDFENAVEYLNEFVQVQNEYE